MIETIKSIKLQCTTGGHDKVYNLEVNKKSLNTFQRYELVAEYGKRLGVLKKIIKGNYNGYYEAITEFDKLVAEKKKKGYQEVGNPEIKNIETKPFKVFILPKKENKEEYITKFKEEKPTITLPMDLYLNLLSANGGQIPANIPVSVPVALVGRKFRDE